MKKYKLGESKDFAGRTLFRVVALVSFAGVSAGDVGGWVEGERNLSHLGNAWVYGNARVYDNAQIFGNARVYDNAHIFGNAMVYDNARATKTVNVLKSDKYYISISDNYIQIGCKNHTIEDWQNFDDETISRMDIGALKWWTTWKKIIFSIIEATNKQKY